MTIREKIMKVFDIISYYLFVSFVMWIILEIDVPFIRNTLFVFLLILILIFSYYISSLIVRYKHKRESQNLSECSEDDKEEP